MLCIFLRCMSLRVLIRTGNTVLDGQNVTSLIASFAATSMSIVLVICLEMKASASIDWISSVVYVLVNRQRALKEKSCFGTRHNCMRVGGCYCSCHTERCGVSFNAICFKDYDFPACLSCGSIPMRPKQKPYMCSVCQYCILVLAEP